LASNELIQTKQIFMFDPNKKENKSIDKTLKHNLRTWSLSLIPAQLQKHLDLSVVEVICNNKSCAPIDTVFTLIWKEKFNSIQKDLGFGMFSLPYSFEDLTEDILHREFPVRTLH
jgi:hypothetical protein